ncbi:pyridoxal phosphate-dependent transferase [Phlyctochytrium arcticum]|nr:pyridoxal phosphate-dependent transferase [Phlyctochytrium arcticum]
MPPPPLDGPCDVAGPLSPLRQPHIHNWIKHQSLTDDNVDEGYDEDFPDEFPFWYGGASGVQHMESSAKRYKNYLPNTYDPPPDDTHSVMTDETTTSTAPTATIRRSSYHDHDSVLHYFIATGQSEDKLDRYLNNIISAFLNEPAPIYAGEPDIPESLRSQFTQSEVPVRRRAGSLSQLAAGGASTLAAVPSFSAEEYLKTVKATVIDRATRVSSPKMIGHMTTALPYFHRPLARLLTAMNQNVVKLETASTMTYLERQTVAMLHREFYKCNGSFYEAYMHSPEHSLGVFCSGGTVANITAMWAARNRALPADEANGFRGVEKEGLYRALRHYGYEGAVIVGSRLMHYSFRKAADLLGLGDDGLVTVDSDDAFRMRTDLLETKLAELAAKRYLVIAVVAIAGTTETGSIDPLTRIATLCQQHKIHFHVDGAWGGPLIFSVEHKPKLNGIQLADSITVDGHKQLYTPMGLGLLLFRNPATAHAIRKTANYVIRKESPDLGKFTLEGSRPATSLHLHASLHLLGRDGLECLVTRSATLARQLSVRVESHPTHAFQALHDPETNIFLFRYIPTELRRKVDAGEVLTEDEDEWIGACTRGVQGVLAAQGTGEATTDQQQHHGFVSRTRVRFHGREVDAFRVVLANPLTSWDDIEDVLRSMLILGKQVEQNLQRSNMGSGAEQQQPVRVRVDDVVRSFVDIESDGRKWDSMAVPAQGEPMWIGWPFDI